MKQLEFSLRPSSQSKGNSPTWRGGCTFEQTLDTLLTGIGRRVGDSVMADPAAGGRCPAAAWNAAARHFAAKNSPGGTVLRLLSSSTPGARILV